jgi:hypothetical protein
LIRRCSSRLFLSLAGVSHRLPPLSPNPASVRRDLALACLALALLTGTPAIPFALASASDEPTAPRVEARSADLLAVGIVRGDVMTIHLSRLIDNSPVRDAQLSLLLRGVLHPAVAQADGGYTLQSSDLAVPGFAAVEFQIVRGQDRENLKGTFMVSAAESKPEDRNSARQLWWWVLNFGVCIGFLWLWSRRRKRSAAASADD